MSKNNAACSISENDSKNQESPATLRFAQELGRLIGRILAEKPQDVATTGCPVDSSGELHTITQSGQMAQN